MMGMRPIVELMFVDFMAVCYDQIINQAAKLHFMFGEKVNVPMVLRMSCGGGTGAAAQHSQSLENMFCHVPGLKVVVPCTPFDAKGLMISSIKDNNPVIFLEPKLLYGIMGEIPDELYSIPLGVADIKREGMDVSIITYGRTVQMSIDVSDSLKREGVNVEVLDLRSLYPLDREAIIETASKTGRVVVVHEAVLFGGFCGEIVSTIAESDAFFRLKAPIKRVGALHSPVPFSRELEAQVLPCVGRIESAVRSIL
jgi:pyruvate dehydrogenase E1 component beta subunit